jgi:ATP-dependent exoDNAse (exonuclease V) beta subunit
MTEQLIDAVERQRALDPSRSFIVQAPAGAGKTELLVRRFLTLLSLVAEPEEIVAITFTRKAAAEMRDRIIGAMRDTEAVPVNESAATAGRRLIAQSAVARDRERGWRLQEYPARLRIQTIDSLCASLTRQMPWLSRFGAPMEIVEDAGSLYREAALETLRLLGGGEQRWAEAVRTVLLHLDNRVDRAVDLLVTMLGRRDQWLRHLRASADATWRAELEAAWARVVTRELAAAKAAVPDGLLDPIAGCARYAAVNLAQRRPESSVGAWGDTLQWPGADAPSLPRWMALADLWLTQANAWRRRLNVNNGFPADPAQRATAMKEQAEDILAELSDNEVLRQALVGVRSLPGPAFEDQQWQVLGALTRLCQLAAAQLHTLFAERGQADFAELGRRANGALGDPEAPSDLALRLDYRIQHLLVDEFQDTSESQRELLEKLMAAWTEGDGHTLFIVGDPMQSIYRFREAEVGIFLQVVDHGIGSLRPEPIRLKVNFRSDPAVVSWVNDAFAPVFPADSDPARGAVSYEPAVHQVSPLPAAGVTVHAMVNPAPNAEATRIVALIEDIRSERGLNGIAILSRARSHLAWITPALEQAKIPYASIDLGGLATQPVVQDLLALLRALLHPADRMSWLAVLRAPWCGLGLYDLDAIARAAGGDCLWEVLRRSEQWPPLSSAGEAALTRCVMALQAALERRGRAPLRPWLQAAWEQLGGPACVGPGALVDAGQLLELVNEHDGGGRLLDEVAFEAALTRRWSRSLSGSQDAVQLMTLHKAKGLEFDTVIIPGLERGPGRDEARLLAWQEDVVGKGLLLAPLHEAGAAPDAHYLYLRRLEKEKDRLESQRLIYVGCTRAVRQLHLFGSVKRGADGGAGRPSQGSLLELIWPHVTAEFESAAADPEAAAGTIRVAPQDLLLRRLPDDWRAPPRAASPALTVGTPAVDAEQEDIEFSWVGLTARTVGVLAHEALQHMAEQGLKTWDARRIEALRDFWRQRLSALGVSGAELQPALHRLCAALQNVLDDPRAQWLFDTSHGSIENEYPLTCVEEGRRRRLRIDRTFVDGEIRWIIDFKTSIHEGADVDGFLDRELIRYRPQLLRYAAAMQALEPRRTRLGLYFPLLRGWRECDTGDS